MYSRSTSGPLFSLSASALLISLSFLWIFFIFQDSSAIKQTQLTLNKLEQLKELTKDFQSEWGTLPEGLTELRAWAIGKNENYSSFDAFGNRIDYLRLSDRHFILRSFGADEMQNTVDTEADLTAAQWSQIPLATPLYRFQVAPQLNFYPALLLQGSHSPNLMWHAQMYLDSLPGTRRLLLRHTQRPNFFLIAPHPYIEEFFWTPDSSSIVFSASTTTRASGGIFLWNIEKDLVFDLTEYLNESCLKNLPRRNIASLTTGISQPPPPYTCSKEGSGFGIWNSLASRTPFIALSGMAAKGHKVYFYFKYHGTTALNPMEFFLSQHLYELDYSAPSDPRISGFEKGLALSFKAALEPSNSLLTQPTNTELQRAWLDLPMQGKIEDVLVAWQAFIKKSPYAPLTPYALWYLSSIYADAHYHLRDQSQRDAGMIKAYGVEIAENLALYPLAPRYLQAIGEYLFLQLREGKQIPYSVIDFSLGN